MPCLWTTFCALVLASWSIGSSAAVHRASRDPVEVRMIPKRVVIHPSSAVVHASANVTLTQGTHTLVLTGVANSVSVNRSVEEMAFQIVSVGGLLTGAVEWVTGPTQEWTLECNRLAAEHSSLEQQKHALEHKISRTQTNVELSARSIQAYLASGAGPLSELDGLVEAYRAHRSSMAEDKQQLDGVEPRLRDAIAELRSARQSIPRAVKVPVTATAEGVFHVQVVYIVSKAGWSPAYEVDVSTVPGADGEATVPVRVRSTAVAWQEGPSDWTDVEVELNTGTPSINRALPELDPWVLVETRPITEDVEAIRTKKYGEFRTPSLSATASVSRSASESPSQSRLLNVEGAEAEDQQPPSPANAGVAHKGLMAAFVLPQRVTIATGTSKVRLAVAELSMKGKLIYDAVPKKSSRVFVAAEVRNDSPFPLIEGSAVGFLDGAFAAASVMPFTPVGRSFLLRLGTDPAMRVERSVLGHKTFTSGGGLLAMLTEEQLVSEVSVELVVKSFKPRPVEVTVWDRVPLSRSEKIRVKLLQPPLGQITPTLLANAEGLEELKQQAKVGSNSQTTAQVDAAKNFLTLATAANATVSPSGIVRWTRYLEPHSTTRTPLSFRVESLPGLSSPIADADF